MSRLVQIRTARSADGDPEPTESLASSDELRAAPNGRRVYVETLGCQMNEADSTLIVGQLRRAGYAPVDDPAAADVILINTCAVREKAEDRVYGRTSQLSRHRAENPGLVIGITGCMAEHLRDKLAITAPHVSLVAGPDSYRNIAALVDRAVAGERAVDVTLDKTETYEGLGLEPHPDDDGVSGFVTIQRGCDKFCTFCVVPYTRGRERGVAPREVLRHAAALAARGTKEVTLLGQTVNSYTWEDVRFSDLLRAVANVEGIERVRFTSPYPVDFTEDLIEVLATVPEVQPFVHLPVQVGSDAVLERMRRGYTRGEFLDLVARLRERVPDIALSTDVMVGFCGETEDDHAQTLDLLRRVRFDSAFMFKYSDRGITYAAKKLDDDVLEDVKGRRLREVIELQERITRESHAARVGRVESVLVTGTSRRRDKLVGRTRRFQRALLPLGSASEGDIVDVRIVGTTGHSLHAEPTPHAPGARTARPNETPP